LPFLIRDRVRRRYQAPPTKQEHPADRDLPRPLHHPVFFCEFGDTAFVVRRPRGQTSQIVG
jgi:hypothetical protein